MKRNDGLKLWNKAQSLIIGGCGLLSKRPTRYSGKTWPNYFKSARGCEITATDGRKYIDFTEFAIGCCPLGYKNSKHNKLMKNALSEPAMTSLLSPYEPELASSLNKFLGIQYSWKFCRGGGEALSLAARFGRAISSKDNILVLGYHGWHDWYLSSNLNFDNQLGSVFLDNLSSIGLPKALQGSVYACSPDNANNIKNMINTIDPGCIFFEAARYQKLDDNIVEVLKDYQRKGGVLVGDEVTTGLRFKKKLASFEIDLVPSIVVLGKALGNSYAISAIGVQPEYHNVCQDCFASSTHWTESIGLSAGVSTLECIKSWDLYWNSLLTASNMIKREIIEASNETDISITMNDLDAMLSFKLHHNKLNGEVLRSVIIDKMRKRGILFSTTIYPSISHSYRHIKKLGIALNKVLTEISNQLLDDNGVEVIKSEYFDLGPLSTGFGRTQKL